MTIFLVVPLEKDVDHWTTFEVQSFEQGRVEILIRRGIFLSEVGDVTGIAFLLYLAVRLMITIFDPVSNSSLSV